MHLKLQAILNKVFYYTKVIGAMLVEPGWSPRGSIIETWLVPKELSSRPVWYETDAYEVLF
jgi:hypothetical protein